MRRGRGPITLLLIAALLATLGAQTLVRHQREKLIPRPRSSSRLTGIDTFALGLVLGGLRGPLCMVLWMDVETSKTERNIEDVDTKIELIRRLQPEFDSVHLFQMWNKAYNLSVQMASMPNKYAVILDAVDYGKSVDEERPDNVNILSGIADLYFNKLGCSSEKQYYIDRMRADTLPRTQRSVLQASGLKRMRHDPLLDENKHLLADSLKARISLDPYNGADLQFLEPYDRAGGFPHGISPLALGYNYYKRAGALSAVTGQKHLQVSDAVLDSRAAITLRYWAEEEWGRAMRQEATALGKMPHDDRGEAVYLRPVLADATTDLPLNSALAGASPAAQALIAEAIFDYKRAAMVARNAEEECSRHLAAQGYTSTNIYTEHRDTVKAEAALCLADHYYLSAAAARAGLATGTAAGQDAGELRKAAAQHYQQAIDRLFYLQVRYNIPDEVALAVYPEVTAALTGRKIDRFALDTADPAIYRPLWDKAKGYITAKGLRPDHADEIAECESYIARAERRLRELKQ